MLADPTPENPNWLPRPAMPWDVLEDGPRGTIGRRRECDRRQFSASPRRAHFQKTTRPLTSFRCCSLHRQHLPKPDGRGDVQEDPADRLGCGIDERGGGWWVTSAGCVGVGRRPAAEAQRRLPILAEICRAIGASLRRSGVEADYLITIRNMDSLRGGFPNWERAAAAGRRRDPADPVGATKPSTDVPGVRRTGASKAEDV